MEITDEMVKAACKRMFRWHVWDNEEQAEMRAALEAALAAAPACPHIRSTGEGTHHCALAAAPQWIACEERLPEAGVEVLVWLAAPVIKYGCQIAIDTWDEQHETPVAWSSATIPIGEGWDSGTDWQDITHWMPLPAAPRSER